MLGLGNGHWLEAENNNKQKMHNSLGTVLFVLHFNSHMLPRLRGFASIGKQTLVLGRGSVSPHRDPSIPSNDIEHRVSNSRAHNNQIMQGLVRRANPLGSPATKITICIVSNPELRPVALINARKSCYWLASDSEGRKHGMQHGVEM